MFCGIGNPEKFKKTLLGLGALVEAEWILADHEPMGEKRLKVFYDKCKSLGIKYLVCTEKDAVKLSQTDLPILFLEIEANVMGLEKLIAKIEERMYNQPN
jgi:tetraacyldisaccharide 4'-kinase